MINLVFSSLIFIYMFLPVTLILYFIAPKKIKNFIILVMSLIFYGWGEPVYILLMLASLIIDYLGALLIEKTRHQKEKSRFIFVTILVINVSVLFFFKYYGFLIDNINGIFHTSLKIKSLPLPLGISFYTFQLISYIADVYMDKAKPQKNIINFATYIAMFPQITSGPIVQYNYIASQISERVINISNVGVGLERFILGLGKKMILANNIGLIWTQIKATSIGEISVLSAWIGIIAFTLQIYFDFSGYSDMAIGVANMLGFEFKENFNYPYISKSITEFWRRWHISLSSWFRDYIYIPLGGNRRGMLIQFRNIFIVWFTTGLWHGASWNFIIWGVYFGVLISIEKLFLLKVLDKLPGFIQNIYTMILVVIGWVFFDTSKLGEAVSYIKTMFGFAGRPLIDNYARYIMQTNVIILILAIICATPLIKNIIRILKEKGKFPGALIVVVLCIGILTISTAYLVSESYTPFLYFKF